MDGKTLVKQCPVHGTEDQRADQAVLAVAQGKLCADAAVDRVDQALFICISGQGIAGAITVNRQCQCQCLQFIPQLCGLRDFGQHGPAQQGDQFFHGRVWHQGSVQRQKQQRILAGVFQ